MKYLTYFLVLVAIGSPVYSLDPAIEASIDDLIKNQFLPTNHIVGVGLAIVSGSENEAGSSMVRGYGFQNLEAQLPPDPSTLFAIGSISKSFTAVAVVKTLSEKYPELGERVLDVPIRQLIPSINFTLSDRFRSESVSFRDLLAHRTCLIPEILGTHVTAPFKDKFEFMYRLRYAPEVCPFRSEQVYNNGIFAMAGELAAHIAGIPFERLLDELFLHLEMTSTTYVQENVDYEKLANMSRAYYRNNTEIMKYNMELLKRVTIAIGSGGILSNANDMLKYMKFHLNKGKIGNRQVVPEEAMSWLSKSAIQLPFDGWKTNVENSARGDFGYGLGLAIGIHQGWELVSHDGYIPPFTSEMSLYPALNIGIFTTSNGPGVIPRESDMKILHAQIFDILNGKFNNAFENSFSSHRGQAAATEVKRLKSDFSSRNRGISVENLTNQIVGLWGHALSGEFNITTLPETEITGEYLLNYGKWGIGILQPSPYSNTTFILELITDAVQDEFADPSSGELPPVTLDFSESNKVALNAYAGTLVFEKDLTLDKLPAQPWDPDSCGPKLD